MPDYAIGDVQGCYEPLMRLLDRIQFDDQSDRLWFVGDLVNRGPDSLKVLRFIKDLPITPQITLGNHDLYLLYLLFNKIMPVKRDHCLHDILSADDAEEIGHWLRKQSILIEDVSLDLIFCHAGIAPIWDINEAKQYALELESILRGDEYLEFFKVMMGNQPNCWESSLTGFDRLRLITNFFTRMRFCNQYGCLLLDYKGKINGAPEGYIPWFLMPNRKIIHSNIVFGHWAALEGQSMIPNLYPIDTGCLWGGKLTALRLQDKVHFSVPGLR